MRLKTADQDINQQPKKYVRVVLTEDKDGATLVEKGDVKELRIGIGQWKDVTARKFITLIRSVVQSARQHKIQFLAVQFDKSPFPQLEGFGEGWIVSTIAENLLIAAYTFDVYKTKKDKKKYPEEILVCGSFNQTETAAWKRGVIVAEHVNTSRDIANTPGSDMTPGNFGDTLKKLTKGTKVKATVFDEARIKKEGLHALWAVGKGADDMPRFVILEYRGGKAKEDPIVLIGKGVTYDTGGLNIKPSGAMHDMHMDMSGGSTVALSLLAVAKLGIKKNIIALIPVAENAVSEKSMRAGDIIKSHSGKTIEVLHTDAEGRLILADALSYAKRYNPSVIIDVATLTGASLVALGQYASAVISPDESLADTLKKLGDISGDYIWPLPLWDECKTALTQTRADVVNIQPNFSKFGGVLEGAAFLSFFAPKGIPWAHLDIAPRMDAAPHDKLVKGSTGEPVRLLVKFLETHKS